MLTRLDPTTPAHVRRQIDGLIDAIEAITTIRASLPPGHRKRECDATISVYYADCAAVLAEWERDAEIEPRGACCVTCAEFNAACDGGPLCSDERRAELRKAA